MKTRFESDLFSDSDEESIRTSSSSEEIPKTRDMRKEYLEYKEKNKRQAGGRNKIGATKLTPSSKIRETKSASAHEEFVSDLTNTSASGDPKALKYVLKKTPIPVVLDTLHLLFYVNRSFPDNTRLLTVYNAKFNVVSKYFLRAVRSDSRAKAAMDSVKKVTKQISNGTPPQHVDNRVFFTQEFMILTVLKYGDVKTFERIIDKTEICEGFKKSCDLIAAFYGVKRFFSEPSRFKLRQSLVVACICGGSVDTLKRMVGSDTEWMTDLTMRKTREMCTPSQRMMDLLRETYGLT